ncbi:MAG: restriction endonuclease subunit S, partial [Bacteroidales bacterium]|nr:restriction endonuclease subunit S [Bacteroidales bacterium]
DTAFGFSPKENVLPKFLFYFCKGFNFQDMNKGTTIPSLVKTDLLQIRIPIPSLPEQQRIVDILDREFAKIDALKANAEKSLQAAKDLFQATLKKELEPKEGWKTQTIGDVCYVQGGSTPRRTEKAFWENGTYPWFTVDDIREQGRIITDTKQKITKLAWERMRVFPANSVLLCCTASVGEYALTTIPITSNQQFNGLTIKDERTVLPMFLFHFASTLKDTLLSLSGKTTIDFVSGGKVRSVPISFPASVKEQECIISRLDDLNEKCSTLQDNYQKTLTLCDDLKQSLLRKAFNGEL